MEEVWGAFDIAPFEQIGSGAWSSCFAVSPLASLAMGAVGATLANYIEAASLGPKPQVSVDRRLASLWFDWSIHPQGWVRPAAWDAIAGDYKGADGWIRLHTNAPHHRVAALSVLNCAPDRNAVAQTVADWRIDALEQAVVTAGGAAAVMRSREDWRSHPQGTAVAAEPLVHWDKRNGACRPPTGTPLRPLAGLRVLDLTRVLAGPVATRTLAGFGAEVLRVDPPDWSEPGVIPEVTLGKHCAHLDLKTAEGLAQFETLLTQADVLLHGYRPGALDAMIPRTRRRKLSPQLIEISLCAYGWTGPWAGRRGFDSLVQMSSGIAEAGMRWQGSGTPHPLPVQALDHATGYFMAAATLTALTRALRGKELYSARLSLARTAELLAELQAEETESLADATEQDLGDWIEETSWGPARRLKPAIKVEGVLMQWDLGASDLGSSPAQWAGSDAPKK